MEEDEYNNLINPKQLLPTEEELEEFLDIDCTIDDLESFLKICEKEEMYEYCNKVQQKIKSK